MYCTDSRAFSLYGNRLSKFRTQVKNTLIGVPVDDIIETSNHFVAFDYLLDTIDEPLSGKLIKEFHRILKTGTADAAKAWFNVGDWKKYPNEVGGIQTVMPDNVDAEIANLNDKYYSIVCVTFEDIIEYHYCFERIHPFQDGNGRVADNVS